MDPVAEAEERRSSWAKYQMRQYYNLNGEDYSPDNTTMSQSSLYQSAQDFSEFSGGSVGKQEISATEDQDTFPCEATNYGAGMGLPVHAHPNPSLFFRDNIRKIDFVLVWDSNWELSTTTSANEKRRVFERNLEHEGLKLEYERLELHGLNFVKIHAPLEVMRRYSEILKLRLPMKELQRDMLDKLGAASLEFDIKIPQLYEVAMRGSALVSRFKHIANQVKSQFRVDHNVFPPKQHKFSAEYSRDKEYLFDIDHDDFFTPAVRARIVAFILSRKRFSDDTKDDFAFGVERLLNEGIYSAAYPIHDGDLHAPYSTRYLLSCEWAAVAKCFKYQPLDYIKEYFGVKIGLYFAWLGFYTYMLIPASIVGILCFLYGCLTLKNNQPSNDICGGSVNEVMCPICDKFCDYWHLNETCVHSQITYLFDNPSTVFFAIFMSFWAAMFLELWKRYSAEITHRWDLTGFDTQEEHPRPEYLVRLAHVKKFQVNIITNTKEPRIPFWKMKVPASIFSVSLVLLLIMLAIAAVIGVILYRMSVLAALSYYGENVITSYAIIFTTMTAASINLVCILLFNRIYNRLAEYLTELELHRTQTQFDDSLTLKHYLLEFINYYASIFYIAFFKGKFVGYPASYNRFLKYRQEECGPGGCLMELCIQLAVIMIGKQAMNTILEILYPLIMKWWNSIKVKPGVATPQDSEKYRSQWAKDYKLVEWGARALFPEYLEMVLQYGFVTIFVAAFPLAPFFALLNNILEMRLDAKKLLVYHRRPVGQRVKDIGVWFRILDSIGKLAVITNGLIISFTSEFIPQMVYKYSISPTGTLEGYLNDSLAIFDVNDFENRSIPTNSRLNVSTCRYHDFREPPTSPDKYQKNQVFWQVLVARLAFVVIFENVVAIVMILIKWLIPDVPEELHNQIRQETYITNEIVIKREMLRARGLIGSGDGTGWSPVTTERELEFVRPSTVDSGTGTSSGIIRNRRPVNHVVEDETKEVML